MTLARRIVWASLVSLIAPALSWSAEAPAVPDFNTHVAPIFKKYCQGCHNAKDAEHGLVLDSYETLLKGGDDGAVISAGRSDQSRLLMMLDGRAKPIMPPEGNEAPSKDEIAVIKAWIDAGAKSPSGKPLDPTLLVTPHVKPLAPVRDAITAVAISPDGKLAALAGYQEVRLIWTESRGVARKIANLRGNVAAVGFSTDGTVLYTAAGEPGLFGEAQLWKVADGTLVQTFTGHTDSLYAAALSPNGKLLATGSYDQQIKLWDTATGKEQRALAGHNGAVFDLAFSPNGKILASASGDRTVKLWDVASGARLDTLGQSLKETYTVAFSPDGKRVVAGGVDNRIRVWQVSDTAREGTNPLVWTRFAHESSIIKLAFARDGKTLVSAAEDRTVKVWDATNFTELRPLDKQPDWVPGLAFGPDNKSVLLGRLNGTYAVYDATTAKVIAPPKPELTEISPRGVQRGTTTKLKLSGKNLSVAESLKFNTPELSGKLLPSANGQPNELWAEVMAAGNLARGAYQVSAVSTAGATAELTLYVDDLPQVGETEPNDIVAQATTSIAPAGYWGVVSARGDLDHFRFPCKKGETYVFELSAKKLGSTLSGVLTVLGPMGQVVAANNDFDGEDDPLVAYRVPADGVYTVRVNDLALNGSANHFYRLSVGTFPYVTGVFPISVPADKETELELAGYNLPAGAKTKVSAKKMGEMEATIDPQQFRSRGTFKVAVGSLPEVLEAEPNDQPAKATPIPAPGTVNGRIWARQAGQTADVDLFRFESQKGQTWIIETDAARRGSPIDTKIEVLDVKGQPVPRLLLQAVRDSYITFRPIDSNSLDARVKNWEEMELNEYLYMQGEVCKIFRMPQGPDSGFQFYQLRGKRRGYFDTSSTTHALDEPCYIVEPHAPGTSLVPTGLPLFTLNYVNDDEGDRKLGDDSRLTFVAPAAGSYLVRVADVRGFQGDRFAYRLTVREAKPDFEVQLRDMAPSVSAGSGRRLGFSAERIDGFDGDITIDISGLPPGFSTSAPLVIQAGHQDAVAVLNAAADAPQPTKENEATGKIVARAEIGGKTVTKEVNPLGMIKLTPKPNLIVRLEPAEVTIAPGATISCKLKVERNGFTDRVQFDVDNLPHGVIVDNIGLSGVLIPAEQSERQIFLTAAPWVPNTSRRFQAVAKNAGNQVSLPIVLHVRKPDTVAAAGAESKDK
jgi:WD40 repeat protein